MIHVVLALYSACAFNSKIVQAYRLRHALSSAFVAMNAVPAIVLAVSVFIWTHRELFRMIESLKARQQSATAWLFASSQIAFAMAAPGGVFVALATLLDPTAAGTSTWANHWMYADGIFQLVFFLLLFGAMAIWFPRHELTGYEYEQPGNEEAGQMIGIMEEVEALPDEEGEAAHE
uniref:Uncharacterized protein n=1 Tax=Zooxanthella nutricula TaxID=1333877 RepID=A0A7S2PZY1_9DINO|mmetsp:Transcript_74937/g.229302  ORF Transcript_74937/g.229302 Transcript_74937/m.229302 type:complete len:176 (+) Transcript_74937:3-530(+)